MKNAIKLFGIIALTALISFDAPATDTPPGPGGENGLPLVPYEDLVIPGMSSSGRTMQVVISTTRTQPRVVLTPTTGDSYVIRYRDAAGGQVSQGIISVVATLTGYSITFHSAGGGESFVGIMSVSGSSITLDIPNIPLPNGGTESFDSSPDSTPGGGGGES